jgi:hypothetical protein
MFVQVVSLLVLFGTIMPGLFGNFSKAAVLSFVVSQIGF